MVPTIEPRSSATRMVMCSSRRRAVSMVNTVSANPPDEYCARYGSNASARHAHTPARSASTALRISMRASYSLRGRLSDGTDLERHVQRLAAGTGTQRDTGCEAIRLVGVLDVDNP